MQPQPTDSHDGHRQRLRKRYDIGGLKALADYEVIEYMLTLFIPRVDVKPIAKQLVAKYSNLRGIVDADKEDLMKIKGLGESAAVSIKFLKDLIITWNENSLEISEDELATVSKLMKYFKAKIGSLQNEVLEVLCFDSQLRLLPNGSTRVTEGGVSRASVDNRKIIEFAIKRGATSIVIAHNHPSGNPSPSLEDIMFTRKLVEACKPINLNLIEHIIVGKNHCYSFRRDGQFDCLHDETLEEGRLGMTPARKQKRKVAQ